MKIGFGCDHAAIDLKNELIEYMTRATNVLIMAQAMMKTEKLLSAIIQTRVVKLVKQL